MKDHSQHGEQQHILDYFGKHPGRFLDIGAYDGVTFSNTRALVVEGWTGVLVEPDPYAFVALMKNCGDQTNLTLVNAALGLQPGLLPFFSSNGDAVSSSETSHVERWAKARVKFTPLHVSMITAAQLLAALPGPYDFVNLDVERTNWELLQTLPLDVIRPKALCVEHDGYVEEMKTWLASRGLSTVLFENGCNLIMGK